MRDGAVVAGFSLGTLPAQPIAPDPTRHCGAILLRGDNPSSARWALASPPGIRSRRPKARPDRVSRPAIASGKVADLVG